MVRGDRVTIRDIARMTGVSMQTVSRVINHRPDVAPATRDAVESAIAAVGFQPSAVARSLVQRRSQTLGVIATGLQLFGVAQTLNGITAASQESGYALLLKELDFDDLDGFGPALDFLVGHRVEGLIVFAPPEIGADLAGAGLAMHAHRPPIVLLKAEPSSAFSTIAVDNHGGATLAARHLVALGRTRIGHLGGPPRWRESRDREAGWRAALAESGIPAGPVAYGDWTSASGAAAFAELLARAPDLDAVFVANDQMALGLLHVANERGLAVPEAIAVVGFDGLVEGAQFTPSLTTVVQPLRELGRLAVHELLGRIEDGADETTTVRNVTLPTALVLRDSAPRP